MSKASGLSGRVNIDRATFMVSIKPRRGYRYARVDDRNKTHFSKEVKLDT